MTDDTQRLRDILGKGSKGRSTQQRQQESRHHGHKVAKHLHRANDVHPSQLSITARPFIIIIIILVYIATGTHWSAADSDEAVAEPTPMALKTAPSQEEEKSKNRVVANTIHGATENNGGRPLRTSVVTTPSSSSSSSHMRVLGQNLPARHI